MDLRFTSFCAQLFNSTLVKYLSIINAKTAELFRISCFLPTVITNQNKSVQKAFNNFGYNFDNNFMPAEGA